MARKGTFASAMFLGRKFTEALATDSGQQAAVAAAKDAWHFLWRLTALLGGGLLIDFLLGKWLGWLVPAGQVAGVAFQGLLAVAAVTAAIHLHNRSASKALAEVAANHALAQREMWTVQPELSGEEGWLPLQQAVLAWKTKGYPSTGAPWDELVSMEKWLPVNSLPNELESYGSHVIKEAGSHTMLYSALTAATGSLFVVSLPIFDVPGVTASLVVATLNIVFGIVYSLAR